MIKFIGLIFLFLPAAQAQESADTILPTIEIFGGSTDELNRPMEPAKVSRRKIEQYQYTDVNRALKNTSGVYMREEDGQGLRPNIGLRGTYPDRSKKIVMMQDGILIGPAPYSAPAAYYTPSMVHTESLEVYKGFAAVPYGPNSVGGAIHYLSPSIPFSNTYFIDGGYGAYDLRRLKLGTGGPFGSHGYLVEGSRLQTEGFKKLDGGGKTGFTQNHVLGRFEFKISERLRSELITDYADENSHETYLGLSAEDFDQSPYRRYSASALDKMEWHHSRFQLRNTLQLSGQTFLEATIYRNDYERTWYRLNGFRNTNVNLHDILNDPTGTNADYLNVLRGDADSATLGPNGDLIVLNNHRTYFSHGLQTRLLSQIEAGGQKHAFEFGVRIHQDQITRDHTSDSYQMISRRLVRTADPRQTKDQNRDSATALTLTASDNWRIGSITLTPVLRYEDINFKFKNKLTGASHDRNDSFLVPGFAVTKAWAENYSVRASVNKAVTAAGISSDGTEKRENATNYEMEFKYRDPLRSQEAGLLAFYNDYQRLTGTCSASSGCQSATDEQFNGGKARVWGLETGVAKGFQIQKVHVPVQANATLLWAEWASEFTTSSKEWGSSAPLLGASTIRSGDPLPYVPRTQYSVSIGTEYGKFKQDFSITYQGKVYDQSADHLRREIGAYGVVDWAASYQISKHNRMTARIDNILDRRYAVSARPFGLRPGKPQSFHVGWIYRY